jgi:hypothetical protein
MSLTVKHLNADASFLLTFSPLPERGWRESADEVDSKHQFTILLDPWLAGTSAIFHPKFSRSTHKVPSCIASLAALPEPDLVIISQAKSDHCHEQTLKTLPPTGTKTLILAEPASAKLIRSWKYFSPSKIITLPKYSTSNPKCPRQNPTIHRIPLRPLDHLGLPGEVTIAYLAQKPDITQLHSAICITYRAPSSSAPLLNPLAYLPLTPPASPAWSTSTFGRGGSQISLPIPQPFSSNFGSHSQTSLHIPHLLSPTSADFGFHHSLRSQGSSTTLHVPSQNLRESSSLMSLKSPILRHDPHAPPHRAPRFRALSVVFSPHGLTYRTLLPYCQSHLIAESALPLTLLLHCFDRVSNPWYLGGNICAGLPSGQEIATRLKARHWISAHDGDKNVRGLSTRKISVRKWGREEVEEVVSPRREGFAGDVLGERDGPAVGVLGVGEEAVLR